MTWPELIQDAHTRNYLKPYDAADEFYPIIPLLLLVSLIP